MLKNDRSELQYAQLVKESRRLGQVEGVKLKLALLADVSTQHLAPLLRILFARNGVAVELYEAGFDTVETETLHPASALYAFAPDVIVIVQSVMKLKGNYYHATAQRAAFAQSTAEGIEGVWRAIRSRSQGVIIQSTFVLPYERPSGNFGNLLEDDLIGAVREINREIGRRARTHPSVLISDLDYLAGWVGRRQFLDEKLWGLAKAPCALEFLPDVAQNIVDIRLASIGRVVKCVVLDLDNTLWGGVIGDDGLEGIGLGDFDEDGAFRSFQLYLRELSARGIVLAVVSKNSDATAREVFRKHPGMVLREEDIAVFIANWDDKATNIRRVRETLNIGFDTMVFLDDNPFERNLVRQLIPGIIVPELPEDPALYVRALSELNLFETASHSAQDASRTEQYHDQQKRGVAAASFETLESYLRSLGTVACCQPFQPTTLGRIAQLIQRSNQFNLTSRRYSEAECRAMMEDRDIFPFTISVRDRFGDFGLINVVILRRLPGGQVMEVDTFLMSCRVLQRGVEQLAMNKIFELAARAGCVEVSGRYLPTAKNMMVQSFYEQFGFARTASTPDGATEWRQPVASYRPREVHIEEHSADSATLNAA